MCVAECFLPLIVENLLLRDRVERISIELLPLLLYTVTLDVYKITRPFPVVRDNQLVIMRGNILAKYQF